MTLTEEKNLQLTTPHHQFQFLQQKSKKTKNMLKFNLS